MSTGERLVRPVIGERVGEDGVQLKLAGFRVGGDAYAIDIMRIKEVIDARPHSVRPVPHAPALIEGVIQLRGVVIPVIDLRKRFGLAVAEFNAMTVTIVLSLHTASGHKEHGFVVDAVRDVVDLAAENIRPAPEVGSTSANDFIEAIATHDEQMLILLNAETLASSDTLPEAAEQAA
jgi:purine-binding chemotaxis protein CheW